MCTCTLERARVSDLKIVKTRRKQKKTYPCFQLKTTLRCEIYRGGFGEVEDGRSGWNSSFYVSRKILVQYASREIKHNFSPRRSYSTNDWHGPVHMGVSVYTQYSFCNNHGRWRARVVIINHVRCIIDNYIVCTYLCAHPFFRSEIFSAAIIVFNFFFFFSFFYPIINRIFTLLRRGAAASFVHVQYSWRGRSAVSHSSPALNAP